MYNKVLVVDDDYELLGLLKCSLQRSGFNVITAETGHDALRLFYNERPDLTVLDISLPGMDGWRVCRRIREVSDAPVLLLTALGDTKDRIRGLEIGADDYLTKPFELRELLARIRAILRRANHRLSDSSFRVFDNGELHIDFDSREVVARGRRVNLTRREFELLTCLIENQGRVLTPQQLLRRVWGPEYTNETAYIKLYIRYLRAKLEEDPSNPKFILTERGFGYRFVKEASEQRR